MINIKFAEFLGYINGKIPGSTEQQRAVAIALGVATARMLPPLPVGNDGSTYHYDTVVVHAAGGIISAFNENVLVDTDLAEETAKAFWLMRQSVIDCHNTSIITPQGHGSFIEKVFGMNHQANPKTISFLNRNNEIMAAIVNRISFLIAQ
jgi:hypothetical protein